MGGDSMTKTLQEIQEFNRKKIICAVNGTENYQEALKLEYDKKGNNTISVPLREYEGEDLTLDRVLYVIRQRGYYDDIWFGEGDDCSLEFDIKNLSWNLFKPTLEKQSKETQRAIHKLLGGENE
jgi:hypothetical protein